MASRVCLLSAGRHPRNLGRTKRSSRIYSHCALVSLYTDMAMPAVIASCPGVPGPLKFQNDTVPDTPPIAWVKPMRPAGDKMEHQHHESPDYAGQATAQIVPSTSGERFLHLVPGQTIDMDVEGTICAVACPA